MANYSQVPAAPLGGNKNNPYLYYAFQQQQQHHGQQPTQTAAVRPTLGSGPPAGQYGHQTPHQPKQAATSSGDSTASPWSYISLAGDTAQQQPPKQAAVAAPFYDFSSWGISAGSKTTNQQAATSAPPANQQAAPSGDHSTSTQHLRQSPFKNVAATQQPQGSAFDHYVQQAYFSQDSQQVAVPPTAHYTGHHRGSSSSTQSVDLIPPPLQQQQHHDASSTLPQPTGNVQAYFTQPTAAVAPTIASYFTPSVSSTSAPTDGHSQTSVAAQWRTDDREDSQTPELERDAEQEHFPSVAEVLLPAGAPAASSLRELHAENAVAESHADTQLTALSQAQQQPDVETDAWGDDDDWGATPTTMSSSTNQQRAETPSDDATETNGNANVVPDLIAQPIQRPHAQQTGVDAPTDVDSTMVANDNNSDWATTAGARGSPAVIGEDTNTETATSEQPPMVPKTDGAQPDVAMSTTVSATTIGSVAFSSAKVSSSHPPHDHQATSAFHHDASIGQHASTIFNTLQNSDHCFPQENDGINQQLDQQTASFSTNGGGPQQQQQAPPVFSDVQQHPQYETTPAPASTEAVHSAESTSHNPYKRQSKPLVLGGASKTTTVNQQANGSVHPDHAPATAAVTHAHLNSEPASATVAHTVTGQVNIATADSALRVQSATITQPQYNPHQHEQIARPDTVATLPDTVAPPESSITVPQTGGSAPHQHTVAQPVHSAVATTQAAQAIASAPAQLQGGTIKGRQDSNASESTTASEMAAATSMITALEWQSHNAGVPVINDKNVINRYRRIRQQ